MATSPENEAPRPETENFDWPLWWQKAEAKTTAILEQIGDDRSTDEQVRHDAYWPDDKKDRSFLLTRSSENGYRCFSLRVITRGEEAETRYEFNSDMRGIVEVEGGDWEDVEAEHRLNKNGFELLAPKLLSYLDTAPVNFSIKTAGPETFGNEKENWDEVFRQTVVSYLADESLVRREILSRPSTTSEPRPVYQSYFAVCSILKTTFGVDDELVRQVFDLAEERINKNL